MYTLRRANGAVQGCARGLAVLVGLWLSCVQTYAACTVVCPDGTVKPCDFSGDGVVNLQDLAILANSYNTTIGDVRWNPACDLNCDGTINLVDLSLFAHEYSHTC